MRFRTSNGPRRASGLFIAGNKARIGILLRCPTASCPASTLRAGQAGVDWRIAITRQPLPVCRASHTKDCNMFQTPVFRESQPDFVQSGPLSHSFGQPFSRPVRTLARIRSLWPFPVASRDPADFAQTEADSLFYAADADSTPSSFVT